MMWCWPWLVPIQEPKTSKTAPCFVQSMAFVSVDWWCVAHIIQLGKAKIMDLLLLCFQPEKQKMFKTYWVLWHSGGMHCVQQNLKPNQAPFRCWDSMPQVDNGSCTIHGRHNENWWMTALSTCIRGLTGQSVPKSKWQKMLFLKTQLQGGQAVAPHHQMPSNLATWLT